VIVQMARENSGSGYDRLANLGHEVSNQTVGNVLRGHGIAPAPKRSQTTRKDFIAAHLAVQAGTDFTAEVLTWRGPATYYVLFVIQLGETAHNPGRHFPAPNRGVDTTGRSQSDRR
jgi:hypothetical protein